MIVNVVICICKYFVFLVALVTVGNVAHLLACKYFWIYTEEIYRTKLLHLVHFEKAAKLESHNGDVYKLIHTCAS